MTMLLNTFKYLFFLFIIWVVLPISANITDTQKDLLENLPPDQRSSVLEKMKTLEETQADIDEVFEKENSLIERTEFDSEEECTECIFGLSLIHI